MPIRILLVRNAGDAAAPLKLHAGIDTPLSPDGRQLAERLAEILRVKQPCAIYSSTSRRARETVAPLSDVLHLPVVADRRLCGYAFDEGYGYQPKAGIKLLPQYEAIMTKPAADVPYFGTETLRQLTDRLVDFVNYIRMWHKQGDTIVASTHRTCIVSIITRALGLPFTDLWRHAECIELGSITELSAGEGWAVLLPKPAAEDNDRNSGGRE